ncbi:MAG: hypothetical protein ACHQX1_01025 [Candidatus Micrarchaeales archaeon]
MALNPEDLLIFKVREEEKPEEPKKAKKPELPATVSQKQELPLPAKESKSLFFGQRQQKPTPAPQAQKPVEVKEPEHIVPKFDEDVIKDLNSPSPEERVQATLETSFPLTERQRIQTEKRSKHHDSRKIAEHMSCELHPWRRAYAVCDYCKRAFCYEDIVESGGKFYCLDDIDKLPEAQKRSEIIRYNNLSLLSSVLFMLVFLLFLYYSYADILTLFSNIMKLGPALFMKDLSASQIYLFLGAGVAIISSVAAIAILLNNRLSFLLSSFVGFATVILFSYQYISVDKNYLIILAGLSFTALVTLAYSRVSYDNMHDEAVIDRDTLRAAKSTF